ncbi:hypothetical protein UFOVP1226_18 [uncultured Caudovirales phage]|uniref:Uncharacterized protein n=1 Tax=uncultured Caudovirales phage TaxID=2100421 RepID=A0A6J5RHE6_9CAUD|nr:hypothetical protein UFOVP278_24 [uncultured Caudovirales phage]CAB4191144.1 hypothetical protein UFOVP1226_18 [uncultured Caudovirales phage]
MKRLIGEISGLVWTLCGTALVLITLSGHTRKLGIYIGITGLVINLVALALSGKEEE